MGFVYVIGASETEQKIGRSDKPLQRLSDHQVSNARTLKLLHVQPTPFAPAVEKIVHHWLRDVHIRGEWYACSPAYAASAVATCAREYLLTLAALYHSGDIVLAKRDTDVLIKGRFYTVANHQWRKSNGRVILFGLVRSVDPADIRLVQSADELIEDTRIARELLANQRARWAPESPRD